jgi:DNA-binding NtrC family response regulator
MNRVHRSQDADSPKEKTMDQLSDLLANKQRIDPENTYIGDSIAILQVFKKIATFNRSPTEPVLILGPTGSGKTQIAELIHTSSPRAAKGFHREQAADNLASDFSLIKAHWVGIGKDSGLANTPQNGCLGLLKLFAGGTMFVDEVHATLLAFQRLMHDVLDGKPIPVSAGKAEPVKPDVRMLFGTNVNPDEAVREGRLLHDFYERIKYRVLEIPPLAERKEDIPLFVRDRCKGYRVQPSVLLCLLEYSWPGNVRELLRVLGLAKDEAGTPGAKITLEHLSGLPDRELVAHTRRIPKQEAEKRLFLTLKKMLERQGWQSGRRGHGLQTQLAKLLGVSPATVTRRFQQYLGEKAAPITST